MIEAAQDTGAFVQLSGVLKRVACKISNLCHDLRLLSFEPTIAWILFKSIEHLAAGCRTLAVNCVDGPQRRGARPGTRIAHPS